MERWEAKLVSLFGMFLVLSVCMALPIKVSAFIAKKGDKASYILGLLRCFAGGVFLGTILLHMIPECHDQIQEFLLDPKNIAYPISELMVVGGFFIILLFERSVLLIHARRRGKKKDDDSDHVAPTGQVMLGTYRHDPDGTPSAINQVLDDAELNGTVNRAFTPTTPPLGKTISGQDEQSGGKDSLEDRTEVNNIKQNGHGHVEAKEGSLSEDEITYTRSIILVLALSFECIFDGLSVGLQLTQTGVWNIFIAIISHEFIIAFCLGVELVKYHSTRKVLIAAISYGMIPPIGCTIGMIITETDMAINTDTVEAVSGLLVALAAGIFLYCTFIGMLGEELIQDATFDKILLTFIGCAVMAGFAAIPDSSDEEYHGDMTSMASMVTDSP